MIIKSDKIDPEYDVILSNERPYKVVQHFKTTPGFFYGYIINDLGEQLWLNAKESLYIIDRGDWEIIYEGGEK